jgi:hypothetical protein
MASDGGGAGKTLSPLEATGIDQNTITWVGNELDDEDECVAVSDYDGLIELQDSLNHKQTQIARVLAKHADPKLAAPEFQADEKGGIRTNNEVYFFRSKDEIPAYIVWNAQLEAAIEDRAFTLNALCMTAEMSQVLLGLKEGAAPTAARTLRLEATNSLSKAARKAVIWKPAIRRVIEVCQLLENTIPGNRYDIQSIGISMRDGLPTDELDDAQTVQTYRAAGVMSIESAVERRLQDPAAVAREIELIKSEAAAAMPTVFSPTNAEPGETTGEADGDGGDGGDGSGQEPGNDDGDQGASSTSDETEMVAA